MTDLLREIESREADPPAHDANMIFAARKRQVTQERR
jgi:hypothetical protein